MKAKIITNNPIVWERYKATIDVELLQGGLLDVLYSVRDKIHAGHELLSHPLSGSVKPNETVYKSALISYDAHSLNMDSLMIIEASIETANKFLNIKPPGEWTQRVLEDFQVIDKTLIDSAIESMRYNRFE